MTCRNCENIHQENFCPNCGEKKFDSHELSVKHFFEETLESFVHFDNKFLRTLKTLLLKPGQLTLDFVEGRRVRFMKPLQIFLVINLIFFFLVKSNIYALHLYNYVTFRPFIDYKTKEIVEEKLKEKHLNFTEYEAVFNEKIKTESKEFIFLFIPFYAIIFAALFFFLRKPFAEHLIFASHFMGFSLIYNLITYYFVTLPFFAISKINYSQFFENFSLILTDFVFFIYLFIAIKRFYKSSVAWSLISALLIALTYFFFIQYYRMFMFFKIIH